LESAKPARTLSKMLLLTIASGTKGTRALRDCSMTVRTVRSDMPHNCTRIGTQLARNTTGSILFSDASFDRRFTETCIDCD